MMEGRGRVEDNDHIGSLSETGLVVKGEIITHTGKRRRGFVRKCVSAVSSARAA